MRTRSSMGVLGLAAAAMFLGGCPNPAPKQTQLVVEVSSLTAVDRVDLMVRAFDLSSDTLSLKLEGPGLTKESYKVTLTPSAKMAGRLVLSAKGYLSDQLVAGAVKYVEFTADKTVTFDVQMQPGFVDDDGDGFPAFGSIPNCTVDTCDCDDTRADVSPFRPEVCTDPADHNCSGGGNWDGCPCSPGDTVPCTNLPPTQYALSGVGACALGHVSCTPDPKTGTPTMGTQCNSGAPGAEVPSNFIDDDCNGVVDEGSPCTPGSMRRCHLGFVDDPANPNVAERLGASNRLLGECAKQPADWPAGTPFPVQRCVNNKWSSTCEGDILPQRSPPQAPGQVGFYFTELPNQCDGLDNDCNGLYDDNPVFDSDQDGYTVCGSTFTPAADDPKVNTRTQPGKSVELVDCDDSNPNVHPGQTEVCGNDVDEDCRCDHQDSSSSVDDLGKPGCKAPYSYLDCSVLPRSDQHPIGNCKDAPTYFRGFVTDTAGQLSCYVCNATYGKGCSGRTGACTTKDEDCLGCPLGGALAAADIYEKRPRCKKPRPDTCTGISVPAWDDILGANTYGDCKGVVSCAGYHFGVVGGRCFDFPDVPVVQCKAGGLCQDASDVCALQTVAAAAAVPMPLCKMATAATCVGTTPFVPVNQPNGTDLFNECSGSSVCSNSSAGEGPFYYGLVDSTNDGVANPHCFFRADVARAQCNGSGACQNRAEACSSSGQGAEVVGRPVCKSFAPSTCQGTTAPAYVNIPFGQDPFGDCGVFTCNGNGGCSMPLGSVCSDSSGCQVGATCVDGVCCESSCGQSCYACSKALNGFADGYCRPIAQVGATDPVATTPCTGTQACDATGTCKLASGQACTGTGSTCATGQCIDGFCCESACGTACYACAQALTGQANGACKPMNTVGAADNVPTNACNGIHACDGQGLCKAATGQSCGVDASVCANGLCVDGMCCETSCTTPCYACAAALTTLGDGLCRPLKPAGLPDNNPVNACAGASACDGAGTCKKANGQGCSLGTDCGTGQCVDGVCCESACTGACYSCNTTATGLASGLCRPIVPAGATDTSPTTLCSGATGCDASMCACNGAGLCKRAVGQACTAGTDCDTGQCVDGFCCASTCTQNCYACAQTLTGQPNGACTPINTPGAPDNYPVGACSGVNSCNGLGQCNKASGEACSGTDICATGFCVDGFCCNTACSLSCDVCASSLGAVANGTCGNASATYVGSPTCSPYTCSGTSTSCATACTNDSGCAAGFYCNPSGVCVAQLGPGASCDPASTANCKVPGCRQCASGNCVDGVCCDSACPYTCYSCLAADTGKTDGSCQPTVAGKQDPVAANGSCASTGWACNGVGGCRQVNHSCTANADCGSAGGCVDLQCCNTTCSGACDACSVAAGSTADGTCADVILGHAGNPACANSLLCAGGSATCPASCTSDATCVAGMYCSTAGTCVTQKTQGTQCTPSADCWAGGNCNECSSGGGCQDGYCCSTTCSGACDACSVTAGATTNGTCADVAVGHAGNPACANSLLCAGGSATCPASCTSDAMCVAGTYCSAAGMCVTQKTQGTQCTPSADCWAGGNCNECSSGGGCQDGYCCNTTCSGACDACSVTAGATTNGTCADVAVGHAGNPACANSLLCAGGSASCPASCTSDAMCVAGTYCSTAGTCVTQKTQGTQCTPSADCWAGGNCNECSSGGGCQDGYCCSTTCSGACDACSVAAGSTADGTCADVALGHAGNPACANSLLCAGGSASCPASCTSDAMCVAGTYCSNLGTCVAQKSSGSCSTADCWAGGSCRECSTAGGCQDGFCCNTTCSGACDACSVVAGSTADGTCADVALGHAGNPACSNSLLCPGGSPNCPASCTSDAMCAAGTYCSNLGTCVAQKSSGSCSTTDCWAGGNCRECSTAGGCQDGFCCNTTCSGACDACSVAAGAATNGTCADVALGHAGNPACANSLLCAGGSATCPASCTSDAMCVAGTYCSAAGTCVTQKTQGSQCTQSADCWAGGTCNECSSGGGCQDGYCCNTTCAGTCDACSVATGATVDGTCANVALGHAGSPACANSLLCAGGSASCPASCTSDAMCAAGTYCSNLGTCVAQKSSGSCSTADCWAGGNCRECSTAGGCQDGFCCNTTCSGACDACSVAAGSTADGTCADVALGHAGNPACANSLLCAGGSATCPASCTSDAMCAAGTYCSNLGTCVAQKSSGSCSTADCWAGGNCRECSTAGGCQDGFCCNTTCSGACDACSVAAGSTADGTCANVALGHAGNPACANSLLCAGGSASCPASCTSDAMCAAGTYCSNLGTCVAQKSSGSCSTTDCWAGGNCRECSTAGGCQDGFCCNTTCSGACDACSVAAGAAANGTCGPVVLGTPGNPSCSGSLVCDGANATCPANCTSDAECIAGDYCANGGVCMPKLGVGAACDPVLGCVTSGGCNECSTAGGCVENVCCDGACGGVCQSCLGALTGGSNGVCAAILSGPDTVPANTCDGTFGCGAGSGCTCTAGHCGPP